MLKQLQHKVPPPLWGVLFGLGMWGLVDVLPLLSFDFNYRLALCLFIGAIGLSIDLYSLLLFIRAKTTVNPLTPSASELVTIGMYRISRNPMYLGMLLVLCAWSLYLATLSAVILVPFFVLVLNKLQIEPEEQALTTIFPEQYPQYCLRVRRWI